MFFWHPVENMLFFFRGPDMKLPDNLFPWSDWEQEDMLQENITPWSKLTNIIWYIENQVISDITKKISWYQTSHRKSAVIRQFTERSRCIRNNKLHQTNLMAYGENLTSYKNVEKELSRNSDLYQCTENKSVVVPLWIGKPNCTCYVDWFIASFLYCFPYSYRSSKLLFLFALEGDSDMCTFTLRKRKRARTIAIAIIGRAITIWEAIQKRSH
jgi:hypothetical protein